MSRALLVALGLGMLAAAGCSQPTEGLSTPPARQESDVDSETADTTSPKVAGDALPASEEEWRNRLTPEQFHVLRRNGTEPAGSGEYLNKNEDGLYCCAGCGNPLYDSSVKFDQGGWPSFHEALPGAVETTPEGPALEVHCAKCKGHLGHIFNDGPGPTRKRH